MNRDHKSASRILGALICTGCLVSLSAVAEARNDYSDHPVREFFLALPDGTTPETRTICQGSERVQFENAFIQTAVTAGLSFFGRVLRRAAGEDNQTVRLDSSDDLHMYGKYNISSFEFPARASCLIYVRGHFEDSAEPDLTSDALTATELGPESGILQRVVARVEWYNDSDDYFRVVPMIVDYNAQLQSGRRRARRELAIQYQFTALGHDQPFASEVIDLSRDIRPVTHLSENGLRRFATPWLVWPDHSDVDTALAAVARLRSEIRLARAALLQAQNAGTFNTNSLQEIMLFDQCQLRTVQAIQAATSTANLQGATQANQNDLLCVRERALRQAQHNILASDEEEQRRERRLQYLIEARDSQTRELAGLDGDGLVTVNFSLVETREVDQLILDIAEAFDGNRDDIEAAILDEIIPSRRNQINAEARRREATYCGLIAATEIAEQALNQATGNDADDARLAYIAALGEEEAYAIEHDLNPAVCAQFSTP